MSLDFVAGSVVATAIGWATWTIVSHRAEAEERREREKAEAEPRRDSEGYPPKHSCGAYMTHFSEVPGIVNRLANKHWNVPVWLCVLCEEEKVARAERIKKEVAEHNKRMAEARKEVE
jgi:hypothetical protein